MKTLFGKNCTVRTRFLLGPAGTGKTFRCLEEIRAELLSSPSGAPLILLAPKQATFQLERQLLSSGNLQGYTRLHILSFERLADFVLTHLRKAPSRLLSEEGRVMVLRALLLRHHADLKIFRSSSRQPGFAQQLSLLLREFQRHQLSATSLDRLLAKLDQSSDLRAKLADISLLLRAYFDWVREQQLHDANSLLDLAAEALRAHSLANHGLPIAGLWLDGFAEMTPQEMDLLQATVPFCEQATLAFCLENAPTKPAADLSIWSIVGKTFLQVHQRLSLLQKREVTVEILPRDPQRSRFSESAPLRHLELQWTQPESFPSTERNDQITFSFEQTTDPKQTSDALEQSIRLALAPDPQGEAILAAREIKRHVRERGRYRGVAVLLRNFEGYHDVLRRTFARYDIPFFLDRKESIAHHPLAELTRSAVRLAAYHWEHDDFFCLLKTGLVCRNDHTVDELENEALEHGWNSEVWLSPLQFPNGNPRAPVLESLRAQVVGPLRRFLATLSATNQTPSGPQLAVAIRELWADFKIEEELERWAEADPVHATTLEQMLGWLRNIEFAFQALRLTDWIPVLDAGLAGLSAGVIPPALDQVLIGTVDRSRNPELDLVLILGANEGVFPASPRARGLLAESDYSELAKHEIVLGPGKMETLGRERFYGYIACTRPRRRLVVTGARVDAAGKQLNPSPFFSLLQRLFPSAPIESFSPDQPWRESVHATELIAPLIAGFDSNPALRQVADWSAFAPLRGRIEELARPLETELAPGRAETLFGSRFETSVSALEQFAACPFRFFISYGLRAKERREFEVDTRERGKFQHLVLAQFHQELQAENKRWRDVTPDEASERIRLIAENLGHEFKEGIFQSTAQNVWEAANMTRALQDFIRATVTWMQQYRFDPHAVELGFGKEGDPLPPWELPLAEGRTLVLRGAIDRVDLFRDRDSEETFAVVIDYKSSTRTFEPAYLANGIQLQLPAYLAFLDTLRDSNGTFGAQRLVPAGIFFVNLRGTFESGATRTEVLHGRSEAWEKAYRHAGRFDLAALRLLDNRDAPVGTQFNYRLKKNQEPYANCKDVLDSAQFRKLLGDARDHIVRMGNEIYAGAIRVDPYKKGSKVPCEYCEFQAICRIDPWTHRYRVLSVETSADNE